MTFSTAPAESGFQQTSTFPLFMLFCAIEADWPGLTCTFVSSKVSAFSYLPEPCIFS